MLDDFHLSGGEDALGGFVAKFFECREEATGEAQFLSEGTDGSFSTSAWMVEHSKRPHPNPPLQGRALARRRM